MNVTVEGLITSVEPRTKNDKKFTELLLAQKGEKEQVTVRLDGHVEKNYELLQPAVFTGRLMIWKLREGIGSMVMAE